MLACVCLLVRTCLVPGLCTWGCIHACKRVYVPIHTCRRTMNTQIFSPQRANQHTRVYLLPSLIQQRKKRKKKRLRFEMQPEFAFPSPARDVPLCQLSRCLWGEECRLHGFSLLATHLSTQLSTPHLSPLQMSTSHLSAPLLLTSHLSTPHCDWIHHKCMRWWHSASGHP